MATKWSRRRAVVGDRVKITGTSVDGNSRKNEEGVVKAIDRYGWAHVLADGYIDTSYVQLKRLKVAVK